MIAITALDKNLGIGFQNKLPWNSIKEDFQYFREITLNKNIIVGRNTFDFLPPLKNRYIKVLTRQIDLLNNPKFEGGEYFSLARFFGKNEFLEWSKNDVLCGGEQVYRELLLDCSELHVTHVLGDYKCDAFFPYSPEQINDIFPKSELVRVLPGGHEIIKYFK